MTLTLHFQLDLNLKSKDGGDISTYVTNGEWALIGRVWLYYVMGLNLLQTVVSSEPALFFVFS